MKGRFEVHGTKPVEILNHSFRLIVEREPEDEDEAGREIEVAEDINEGEIMGSDVSWPYTLQPGEPIQDSFCMVQIDLEESLRELGYEDPAAALSDPYLKVFLVISADVKGTIMDAEVKVPIKLLPDEPQHEDEDEDDADEGEAALPEARFRVEPVKDERPYLERFEAMVEELRSNPQITIETYKVNPPATEAQIAAATEKQPISAAMRRFYLEANGLELVWSVEGGEDQSVTGRVELLPIEVVFKDWKGNIWFDEEWDDGQYKPLHPLDFFVDEACAAIYVDGSDDPKIYYHYCGEEMSPMEANFEQYMELLFKTRGFWYWQTAIACDLTGQEYTTSPGNFRRWAARLFSDYDERFFFRRSYTSAQEAEDAKRAARVAEINAALGKFEVDYTIKDEEVGYITVVLADDPANFAKAKEAFLTLDLDYDFDQDWGMMSIGEVMVERAS